MPILVPPIPFLRRRRRPTFATPNPPAALTLQSATYDNDTVTLTLTFDRAIDIAGIVVGADVIVYDGSITANLYESDGATLVGPESVRFTLNGIGEAAGPTTLTASARTGIVAVDDGGTWAGVTELELPFP